MPRLLSLLHVGSQSTSSPPNPSPFRDLRMTLLTISIGFPAREAGVAGWPIKSWGFKLIPISPSAESQECLCRMRMVVGVKTVNAPSIAAPCSRMASATIAAFFPWGNPAIRRSKIPLETRCCLYTRSPKSLSDVNRTACWRFA